MDTAIFSPEPRHSPPPPALGVTLFSRRYSGLSRLDAAPAAEASGEGVCQISPRADVTRQRPAEEAWLRSAAAEKYDMGLSEEEGESETA